MDKNSIIDKETFEVYTYAEDHPKVFVCDKMIGDEIVNPKGIRFTRTYSKEDNFIYLAFGIEINKVKTNFYFQTSKSHHYFQVNNSFNKYLDAINGKLPYLGAVSETIS